jgi:hypothetical protein
MFRAIDLVKAPLIVFPFRKLFGRPMLFACGGGFDAC